MKSWGVYLMGIITGAAVLLAVERASPRAEAAPVLPGFSAVQDNVGGVFLTAVGSSQANRNDILWVAHARPLSAEDQNRLPEGARNRVTHHIEVCTYRIAENAGSMGLISSRNATLDFALDDYTAKNDKDGATPGEIRAGFEKK